ncbi:MAG: DUF3443 family protein [Smithella sp.]
MKLNKFFFFILISSLIMSCGGGGSSSSGPSIPTATLVSIAVTPATPGIAWGGTQQFTATGTYSDGTTQDITTSVTWSSSDTTEAPIGNTGLVTTSSGTGTIKITITASSGSISGSATLAVVASFNITPTNETITLGATQQFTATATFSDSSTQDITTSVTWSSSDTTVAAFRSTAGSNGLATSFAAGATKVSASLGSVVSPSTTLTVNSSNINNVITVTVNGGIGIPNVNVPNWPYVSVMVCSPSTTNCITIPNILLDTGSYGLRIFKSFLTTVSLTQITSGSGSLTECVQYADGTADWGPVQTADVVLGNERATNVPIQVINSSFGQSSLCIGTLDTSPTEAGYNGILGVGPFTQDCGSDNGCKWYYSCNDSSCTLLTTVSLSNQVSNPVSLLSTDNNGVILRFPIIPLGGVSSVTGDLVLGIDTESNNSSSGATMYPADLTYGYISTVFNGNTYKDSCYIDSGSNGLFFPDPTLPTCDDDNWYCPSSTQSFSATIEGYSETPSNTVSFQIGDAATLLNTSNEVFIELGGPYPSSFDWGLPFFLGRSVYVGIEGQPSSNLGAGPYWAF